MNSRVKWSIALAAVAVAAAVVAHRLTFSRHSPVSESDPPYREVVVERGSFRLVVTANGLVRPIDRIEIKSKASGKVIELPIEAGQPIAKGALIAKLDQVDAKTDLELARADLEIALAELALAEKNFERRKELFGRNVISLESQDQTELDFAVARGKRVQATIALEQAKEQLEDTIITAPVRGLILQKYVERGQIIASGVSNVGGGTPIADIADMRTVHVEAGVDEIDIGKITLGQRASIRAEAFPQQRYEGEITRIAPEARIEQNVTLFDVTVHVENTDGNLRSGMNTTMEIVVVDESDVLTIPVTALQRQEGSSAPGAGVVLVKGTGQVKDYEARRIRIGRTDHRVVEVLEGLQAGDRLGIPMVSRLKAEHDRRDARIRNTIGAGTPKGRGPEGNKSPRKVAP
jgi:HlyD family secretion protein